MYLLYEIYFNYSLPHVEVTDHKGALTNALLYNMISHSFTEILQQ